MYLQKYFLVGTCMALNLENGDISYTESPITNGGYPVDTVASFICNNGYSKSGPQWQTCQSNKTWDQQTPTCTQSNKLKKQLTFSS